jgi:hypothetical protein
MKLMTAVVAALLLWIGAGTSAAQGAPILFDTDIGTDVDDAYALALILRSPELELVGVTTVSGDAVARARLAARLLALEGGAAARVPVHAGISSAPQYIVQTEWAAGFTSPALHTDGGVAFMRQQIEARPGQLTIVAVGELTNVAALLTSSPGIGPKIKRIALMGGAVRRGGQPGSTPQPEWNIKSNAAAAPRPHLQARHAAHRRARRPRLRLALLEHLEGRDADHVRRARGGVGVQAGDRLVRAAAPRGRGRRIDARGGRPAGECAGRPDLGPGHGPRLHDGSLGEVARAARRRSTDRRLPACSKGCG